MSRWRQWALTRYGLQEADSLQRGDYSAEGHPVCDLLGTSRAYLALSQAQGGQLVALLLDVHKAECCLLSQPIVANAVHMSVSS